RAVAGQRDRDPVPADVARWEVDRRRRRIVPDGRAERGVAGARLVDDREVGGDGRRVRGDTAVAGDADLLDRVRGYRGREALAGPAVDEADRVEREVGRARVVLEEVA